ncbi:AMP-binding protein [Rhodococcus sp. NCIMB 12038]|uniref:AMP-binding protein n=1 Tax=Rhodococcus sp. NCIMB 12038 TaxID=933800 RepID=UPI00211B1BC2|nr:AMP-binding protein [Rhodococcus sp. NCIMB 12038]
MAHEDFNSPHVLGSDIALGDDFSTTALLRAHAAARASAVAIRDGERQRTYGELSDNAHRVAQQLLKARVQPGHRICFLARNRLEFFELWFGCAWIGAALVPLNWRLTPHELAPQIVDSCARLVFTEHEFAAGLTDLLDEEVVDIDLSWTEWLQADNEVELPDPAGAAKSRDRAVLQQYTSGTTGIAKGVIITESNLGHYLNATELLAIDAGSVVLGVPPLFHIGGINLALSCLHAGGEYVLLGDFTTEGVLDLIESHRITNAFLVPSMIAMLLDDHTVSTRDFSSLRRIVYGASPITSTTLRRAIDVFGVEVTQVYGMTETTGAVCQLMPADHDPDGPREHLLRSAGKPYPWVELRVVDFASGVRKDVGNVGEVQIRAVQSTPGYWHRDEATNQLRTDEGWLRTGDAGWIDAEGYLYLVDRVKDMIVSGGENVYPAEVENEIAKHPAVRDVAVIGVPDPKWGEAVKAIVVVNQGHALSEAELLDGLRDRLAGYKRPKSVDFVETLPRNANGKLLKRALRENYWPENERLIG